MLDEEEVREEDLGGGVGGVDEEAEFLVGDVVEDGVAETELREACGDGGVSERDGTGGKRGQVVLPSMGDNFDLSRMAVRMV